MHRRIQWQSPWQPGQLLLACQRLFWSSWWATNPAKTRPATTIVGVGPAEEIILCGKACVWHTKVLLCFTRCSTMDVVEKRDATVATRNVIGTIHLESKTLWSHGAHERNTVKKNESSTGRLMMWAPSRCDLPGGLRCLRLSLTTTGSISCCGELNGTSPQSAIVVRGIFKPAQSEPIRLCGPPSTVNVPTNT